jgi:hypothetical protein
MLKALLTISAVKGEDGNSFEEVLPSSACGCMVLVRGQYVAG